MLREIKKELKKYSSTERKKTNEWFFKTGKGEYGEGDIFIGVRVPDLREIAKQFYNLSFKNLEKLISSKIHEERLLAIFVLVLKFQKEKNKDKKREILDFYLKNLDFVNNWDIVDSSAYQILGESINLKIENKNILDELVKSENMWFRRVAIISTFAFIKIKRNKNNFKISKKTFKW